MSNVVRLSGRLTSPPALTRHLLSVYGEEDIQQISPLRIRRGASNRVVSDFALITDSDPVGGVRLADLLNISLRLRHELHLEHPGPQLARDEKRIFCWIIGDAVEYAIRPGGCFFLRCQQAAGIDHAG